MRFMMVAAFLVVAAVNIGPATASIAGGVSDYFDPSLAAGSEIDDVGPNDYNQFFLNEEKRGCVRRGGNCDHRPNDCCHNSSCRCNLWGSNCRCQRMGLFQKWG